MNTPFSARLPWLALALVTLLPGTSAASPDSPSSFQIRGEGGRSTALLVGEQGMRLSFPPTFPRLPGPDGAVGGVVVHRMNDSALLGGVLLQNIAGFPSAIDTPIAAPDGEIALPRGRYRLTLIGRGAQSIQLQTRGERGPILLRAGGPPRAVTTSELGSSAALHRWSTDVGAEPARSVLVLGAGTAGQGERGGLFVACVAPGGEASDEDLRLAGFCAAPDRFGYHLAPGGGGGQWSADTYVDGLATGSYTFSGWAAGMGAPAQASHSVVEIRFI